MKAPARPALSALHLLLAMWESEIKNALEDDAPPPLAFWNALSADLAAAMGLVSNLNAITKEDG